MPKFKDKFKNEKNVNEIRHLMKGEVHNADL